MNRLNEWDKLIARAKASGIRVSVSRANSPIEEIRRIGVTINTREVIERDMKRPLTRAEKKRMDFLVSKIRRDANRYISSIERKNEK